MTVDGMWTAGCQSTRWCDKTWIGSDVSLHGGVTKRGLDRMSVYTVV